MGADRTVTLVFWGETNYLYCFSDRLPGREGRGHCTGSLVALRLEAILLRLQALINHVPDNIDQPFVQLIPVPAGQERETANN